MTESLSLCPHCGKPLTSSEIASLFGRIRSEKRAEASRRNGAKGGRKKGSKNKPKSEEKVQNENIPNT